MVRQVVTVCLGAFSFGYMLAVFNPLQNNLIAILGVTPEEKTFLMGLITACFIIGAMIGAILCVPLSKYSPRQRMRVMDVIGILAVSLTIVPDVTAIVLGRTIAGVFIGMNPSICPTYVNQIAPKAIRGKLGVAFHLTAVSGIMTSYLMGIYVDNTLDASYDPNTLSYQWWRVMFLVPVLSSLTRLILLSTVYVYDTPAWNVEKG